MSVQIFIAKGRGYADDKSFDDYEVIAEPLPKRDDRVFGRKENGNGGTCYGSHSIKLAVRRGTWDKDHYLLISHGGGTEIMRVRKFYDGGAMIAAVLTLPEREQYAFLYTLYASSSEAAEQARSAAVSEWSQAFVDKRIKRTRAKQGRCRVFIEPPASTVAPSGDLSLSLGA